MSNRARNFLIGIGVAIVLAFVVAGVAILAYNAGRNSIDFPSAAGRQEGQDPVVVSVENDEITIVPTEVEEQTPITPTPEAEPTKVVQPTGKVESNETATPEVQEDEPTATPEKLDIHAKAKVLEKHAWTAPTMIGTRLFIRDYHTLKCLDLGIAANR